MKIEIEGLTEAQKIALEDFLYEWVKCGEWGTSRWTAFFADGDGNFHPKITIDGNPVKQSEMFNEEELWRRFKFLEFDGYPLTGIFIDFDPYAWKLRNKKGEN